MHQDRHLPPFPALYETLGVTPSASESEIRAAFRRCTREFHPDVTDGQTTELFKTMIQARDVLCDPMSRANYDAATFERPGPAGSGPARSSSARSAPRRFGPRRSGYQSPSPATEHPSEEELRRREACASNDIQTQVSITAHRARVGGQILVAFQTGKTGRGFRAMTVLIPPGCQEGQVLRYSRLGNPGSKGIGKGDLLVTLHIDENADDSHGRR